MLKSKKYKLLYKIKNSLNCSWDSLMKLSDEQADYIKHYLKYSSFLKACPGAGKTEVIGIKAAFEIYKWKPVNSGIAVVTFTTSAARELNNRIRKFGIVSSETFPHFIGTFDSWIHSYILQPFAHYLTGHIGKDGDKSIRLVDVESSAGFLSNYTTIIYKNGKSIPVKVTEYYYDFSNTLQGQGDITDRLLKGALSDAERQSLLRKKKEFIIAGFITYSDVEWLCNLLFAKFPLLQERFAQRFPVIIIDECQDLSKGQINILELLRLKGTNLHFVGDIKQSIYDFRKVNPDDISDYIQYKLFKVKMLTNNFRSCQPIVDLAENIIGSAQHIIGNEIQMCPQPCLLWQYDDQSFLQLPKRFEEFIKANGLDHKKSVILARGKSTLMSLRTQSDKYSFSKVELFAIALHNWYKINRTTDDLNNALLYLGRFLCLLAYNGMGDGKNQYCPNIFETVEWRLFLQHILLSAKNLYPFEENGHDLTWAKWIKKLKIFLSGIWDTLKGDAIEWNDAIHKLRSPDNKKDLAVKDICSQRGIINNFRTTTIHSVKGETLDAVLLISHPNKKSQGGHFSHWLREGIFDSEHIRFAYVAASRPKHAFLIATPQLSSANLIKFQKLGFIIQP